MSPLESFPFCNSYTLRNLALSLYTSLVLEIYSRNSAIFSPVHQTSVDKVLVPKITKYHLSIGQQPTSCWSYASVDSQPKLLVNSFVSRECLSLVCRRRKSFCNWKGMLFDSSFEFPLNFHLNEKILSKKRKYLLIDSVSKFRCHI